MQLGPKRPADNQRRRRHGATRTFTAAGLCAIALAWAAPAAACPGCAAGQDARREVWEDRFFYNLAAAALPFVIVAAVGARLHGVGAPRGRRQGLVRTSEARRT